MSCAVKLSEIMKLTHFKLYFMSNAYQYKLEEYELSITRGSSKPLRGRKPSLLTISPFLSNKISRLR